MFLVYVVRIFLVGQKTLHVKTFPCKILVFQVYVLTHMYVYIYIHLYHHLFRQIWHTYMHTYRFTCIILSSPFQSLTLVVLPGHGAARVSRMSGVAEKCRGFLRQKFIWQPAKQLIGEKKTHHYIDRNSWGSHGVLLKTKMPQVLSDVLVCWGTISLVQVSVFWGEEILVFWGFCLYTSTTLLEMIFAVIKNDFGIRFGVFPIRSCNNQNPKFQERHKKNSRNFPTATPQKKTQKKIRTQLHLYSGAKKKSWCD